ncbi:unnamed protein product [Symbiodinium necroappetens]|uniref:Uncharacterized protein n=1 Tax=Symbiodinium necroappetens TaxID=1628268 RepID=A0A812XZ08_9DINO|nr:unnamed protein product [Symbiodinium necroappetens]
MIRGLTGNPAYWVCAYANNQHDLEEAISANPRKTSFYQAMQLCQGVLLVLDSMATPFSRVWCCFEESIAAVPSVRVENAATLCRDVAAADQSLAGAEASVLPLLGLFAKSQREKNFPVHLLQQGLGVDIETARASQDIDKVRILNSIAFPRSETLSLNHSYPEQHGNYAVVNKALASLFALHGLPNGFSEGDAVALLDALRADSLRTTVNLELAGCARFRDADLQALLSHLPERILQLHLELCFTGLEHFRVVCLPA